VTGPAPTSRGPALLARLLTEPDLLSALERRDFAALCRDLTADTAELSELAALDVGAIQHYLRLLQRKRLEIIEPAFPASLPVARKQYGADDLAASFWRWYRQPATVPAHDIHADTAAAWSRFAVHLAQLGPVHWLGDLSRYELMRWASVFYAERPGATEWKDERWRGRPVLAPGARVAEFEVDVTLLLRTAAAGSPEVAPTVTRLITWPAPAGGIKTARLGAAAYQALLACDGSRPIEQIGAMVGSGRDQAGSRIAASLNDLVRAGALRLSDGEGISAEQHDSGSVEFPDS
jgi:hypothetical protein